ncbi:MAG: hypothetical protein UV74_C0013G0252 [Candidatus Woesebacteria bacterium GW2011_GWB1_43_14]|uniref:DUF378 domain-containing protein n=1 Tax=Candidatus Woesebacteria bacterium GW2011_GWB1_43_14 TaxID=1618578 RepID=A0A0G1DH09_9BACT|nr:MAG: hypothetical protein UT21_C0002G0041 [Candidatus Woesebacteria bacterium GW2011_GWA1_39_11b]KKS78454.1 MAG: hypothetical protein UV51_C0001G0170 [Candidatus Woesebacteria bacterium GW2011_GWC1_42_9]KKS97130.1 MAG: hypothetical protein UV74_C0013G0252 [Candidatus Woesebacteria bacterium GW2011_GWB1_43_14]
MKKLWMPAMVLLVIGGLNWGLVGLFDFNLVTYLFGATILTQTVYVLVGAAALWKAYLMLMNPKK